MNKNNNFIQREIQDQIEYEKSVVVLCALTGVDYATMRARFNDWIKTQPLSWREGYAQCMFALRYGVRLPFLQDPK